MVFQQVFVKIVGWGELYIRVVNFMFCLKCGAMYIGHVNDIDGLVQDCSIPSALALEILQSYTKPSTLS